MGDTIVALPVRRGLWWQGVPPQDVAAIWPAIEDMVAELLQRGWGEFEPPDVLGLLEKAEMQLWLFGVPGAIELAVITRVGETPQLRFGEVWGLAGDDLDKYLPFLDSVILPWMKERGCAFVEVIGRPGLERKLRSWTRTSVVLRKQL